MMRCPRTGAQLRFERQPTQPVPFYGPYNAKPMTNRGDFWVAVGAIIAAFLVATSELLGWPMP